VPDPVDIPEASRRVVEAGRALGVEIDVNVFPEGTKTSADAAAAIGCDLSAIAKSIVFVVDGEPVVALASGDHRIDPERLAAAAGGEQARRAGLEEARDATGYAAGGTPAFGHARTLRVFADTGLRRNDPVWSAAGTPTTVYPIALDDLIRASGAEWAEIAG
jgi:prolyl-tRNA editing enzyme YbaK/EbsC (Cys-tRNA(Pro) deacylase)